ncbi:MAG: hypothetical protein A2514_09230 [Gammaproteobacteria bacterium RIFOXYD12_FULL_61_37]|nr:MAG: hypothetical protein A2514_09230 [Gammaproteobacteria bacterium RIFOXYD12_FULL_61_37]
MLENGAGTIIAEELRDLRPSLDVANALLTDPSAPPESKQAALSELVQAAGQLSLAAEVIEHQGLLLLAEWLGGNAEFLTAMVEGNPQGTIPMGLFCGWLDALILGLTSSGPCRWDTLAGEMKRPAWPDPADDELLGYITGAMEPEQAETDPTAAEPGSADQDPAKPKGLIALRWDEDVDPRLLDAFFEETPELAAALAGILHSYRNGAGDTARAKRLAHTIKGSCALIGLASIAGLTHALEDTLELLVGRPLDPAQAELLSETADWLEAAFEALPQEGSVTDDCLRLQAALHNWDANLAGPAGDEPGPGELTSADEDPDEEESSGASTAGVRQTRLRVPLAAVDELMRLVGEQTIGIGQMQGRLQNALNLADDLTRQDNVVQQRLSELEGLAATQSLPSGGAGPDAGFDPLEMDRYHELHGLSNAFVEALADSRRLNKTLHEELTQLRAQLMAQVRLGREFNTAVLDTRLEPASKLDQRLHRAVREATRQTGKKARLEIKGSDLLLDTDILNTMVNPLVHMLRNAVDHGIELPELRTERGKAEEGLIQVIFTREGNRIKIIVSDDGGGIDPEQLRRTARRRGLIGAQEAPDDQGALRLILRPGFTTRMQANQLSGRGIGLDLVRQSVDNLRGTIDFDNEPGAGCRFTLRLPLTLVSVPALLVRAGDRISAIPSASVDQLLYAERGSVRREGQGWVFFYGSEAWPVMPLARLLGGDDERLLEEHAGRAILLAQGEDAPHALLVEAALANREVVVKSLGPWLPAIKGISGACILTDGSVAPVLDLPRLMRGMDNIRAALTLTASTATPLKSVTPSRVLVVDDSISARQALLLAVNDAGFQVLTAIDGLDAIRVLEETPADLVVTDLEMPRMNGFELISHLRANARTRDLPVIVVTSRSTRKHRERAELAGADLYLTKPFDAKDLGIQMSRLLESA